MTVFCNYFKKTALIVVLLCGLGYGQGSKFLHIASSSNIISNWTVMDHPLLNGNPNAIVFITPNWNPPGGSGVYNNAATGVWYDGSRWAIYNQDISAMPEGAAFNVFVHNGSNDFVHTATTSNIISNWTVINNPALNGNPNAIFFTTPDWNPGGTGGVYNNAETGVWYDGSNWSIYNQDLSAMPEGASFNVFVHNGSDDFVHTATTTNIISNWTVIDNAILNNNPGAVFLVTQNWNPNGGSGTYNNTPIGVWYDGSKWAVFNQDLSAMPEGADFNVYLANSGVTDVDEELSGVAESYNLEQNYPNPFNPSTKIRYQIPESGNVTLKVFDALGREITTLVNGVRDAGIYEAEFNADGLSSGIYFYTIKTAGYVNSRKMMLLK